VSSLVQKLFHPDKLRIRSSLALAGVLLGMPENNSPTSRTRVVREPHRGVYDRETAYQILDEAFICHVGFILDGQPFVIPTGYGRAGDNLYIHGSAASRMLRNLDQGVPVCVTVTILDGLVLARSIFNHSMNYRSVVVLGTATAVADPQEKLTALRTISEHIIAGRWADSRQPTEKELKATLVMRLPMTEFSAKIRQGDPIDDEEDYSFPTWAGVIPLQTIADKPMDDPRLMAGQSVPAYAKNYQRPGRDRAIE
jgi:nitroimidazol reductase NimA-like FMN-containing flavoprotein (pyridoxamine 5'-phosphate oxidase superfamily)